MSTAPLLKGAELEFPLPNLSNIKGLTTEEAKKRQEMYGKNEIPEKKEPLWWLYLKQFMGPMPMMIEIAAILSACIQSWADFAIILALLFTNGTLGFIEEVNARASVDALKSGLMRELPVVRDGKPTPMAVTELVPGDILFLRGGNVIPADCYFCEGDELQIDQAALTGESLPVTVPREDGVSEPGDGKCTEGKLMYSGAILKQGECHCVVWKTGVYTMMGEAATAIQDAGGKSEGLFEGKIKLSALVLILITIVVVVVLFYYNLMIVKKTLPAVLESSLSLVIASVPVALPMVMKVTLSLGAKEMADEGGIVTHLTALEEIASMRVLCSDKTGTLTTAKMTVYYEKAECFSGYTQEQVMKFAAVASNPANKDDPIDTAVYQALTRMVKAKNVDEAAEQLKKEFVQEKYVGFNPIVKRTVAFVKDAKTGKKLQVAKGIVNKVLKTGDDGGVQWTVEDFEKTEKKVKKGDAAFGKSGFKTIAVAVGEPGGKMFYAGTMPIMDPPREDTLDTIANIRSDSVEVKMITGDHLNIAQELARQINLGANILPSSVLHQHTGEYGTKDDMIVAADGFAQVMPIDKLEVVATLQNRGLVVGMTGDGVNDAPALAKAQIGIAVEGATDAAQSAADIVLTKPGLSPIYTAIEISRRIFKRLKSYVIYRICITVQVVFFLTAIAFMFNASFKPIYIILLALLHDLQIVTIAYDHQIAGRVPETPTVLGLLIVSYAMGLTMCIQTVLMYAHGQKFLYVDPTGNWGGFACVPNAKRFCEYKDSAMFLQISNSSAILILSARSVGWFFSSVPAWQLLFSTCIGQIFVNGMMLLPPLPYLKELIHPLQPRDMGLIWAYDLVWLFVLDFVKFFMYYLWNIYEESAKVEDPFIAKQRRKSMNSTEANVPGRKGSFKRPSVKK